MKGTVVTQKANINVNTSLKNKRCCALPVSMEAVIRFIISDFSTGIWVTIQLVGFLAAFQNRDEAMRNLSKVKCPKKLFWPLRWLGVMSGILTAKSILDKAFAVLHLN